MYTCHYLHHPNLLTLFTNKLFSQHFSNMTSNYSLFTVHSLQSMQCIHFAQNLTYDLTT